MFERIELDICAALLLAVLLVWVRNKGNKR